MEMNKYLIIYETYNDEKTFVCEAVSLHDCIVKFAKYTGISCELFDKAIIGLSTDKDFIDMYNHFSQYDIDYIYQINKEIYCGKSK